MNWVDGLDSFLTRFPYGDCSPCRGMYIYFAIIILLIYLYVIFIMAVFGDDGLSTTDYFNVALVEDSPIGPIGGWPISHFLAFFIAGLLFPDCFVLAMALGVLWEIYETVCGNLFYNDRPRHDGDNRDIYEGKWMKGRIEDIIFDFLGFILGKLIIDSYRDNKYGGHRQCTQSSLKDVK